jgi:hypothetical protein
MTESVPTAASPVPDAAAQDTVRLEAGAPAGANAGQPRYRLQLSTITGTLLVATRKTRTYSGTMDELAEHYRRVKRHNLTLGWWGITAIVWNIMAMIRNRKAMAQLHQVAAGGPQTGSTPTG